MRLLANSFYGFQIMDRSQNTVKKINVEKKHAAIKSKLFKKPNHVKNAIYEVELATTDIEHKELIIVGYFILQYAKLRMFELFDVFFNTLCVVNKIEELEMDTDSLYLALVEKELKDCIQPEMKAKWARLWSRDWTVSFTADAVV